MADHDRPAPLKPSGPGEPRREVPDLSGAIMALLLISLSLSFILLWRANG
jgi:hypothetical protein